MARGTIYVINPNSNASVTNEIDAALAPLRRANGPRISCLTLDEGPPGIESERDAARVIVPLLRRAASLERDAAAFVVACFSDPGIHALREQSARPVFGIAECGVLTAMALGRRVGIIAILPASVARHHRYFTSLGLTPRIAGDLPIGLRVGELADQHRTLERMLDAGRTLRDVHGADVLVLGCAGMARYRSALEKSLGVPVVDPTQATVAIALGRLESLGDG